ncbi:hypothetical protein ABBQ38_006627 [Trebouxia sp. C0009 RCD-2024]
MGLGALFCGSRLVPVTGGQLVKLSPFRSFVVTIAAALDLTIVNILRPHSSSASYVFESMLRAPHLQQ